MSLLNKAAQIFYANRIKAFSQMAEDPIGIQKNTLKGLLRSAKDTAFGREHHFNSLYSYADFCERIPVSDYEHFAPYIERMMRGEQDVCWPGLVKWFAKSSGTTDAKSKFIPVTDESLHQCQFRGAQDVIATYLNHHPDTKILTGKCLTLGGSKKISPLNGASQTGDLSAIMLGNAPWLSTLFKTPKRDIALMDKWEEKLKSITEATMGANVTWLAGVPSWVMILLRHIMETKGVDNIQDVWPNLEMFAHGGINFEPYREQYKKIAPRGLNFVETYNASEGFFALQTDPEQKAMQLMLDYGIFMEFVPLDEVGDPYPKHACSIRDVLTGVDYALVISTNGGLWRYMIGDTVRFTSTKPHRIVISGRTKLYINAFGEELMIGNAEAAMRKACEKTGAVVAEYTAAPVFMDGAKRGCHQWLVEFAKEPDSILGFQRELDEALQEVNSDYEAKRYKDITLAPLMLTVARKGLFFEWMQRTDKLGGQNKVPRLVNDRHIIDEILKLAK